MTTVQYRITRGKASEVVSGPDDAEVTLALPAELVGSDLTLAFMQGKLKTEGSTGAVFELLRSGEAAAAYAAGPA
jgi:hypothetical protein